MNHSKIIGEYLALIKDTSFFIDSEIANISRTLKEMQAGIERTGDDALTEADSGYYNYLIGMYQINLLTKLATYPGNENLAEKQTQIVTAKQPLPIATFQSILRKAVKQIPSYEIEEGTLVIPPSEKEEEEEEVVAQAAPETKKPAKKKVRAVKIIDDLPEIAAVGSVKAEYEQLKKSVTSANDELTGLAQIGIKLKESSQTSDDQTLMDLTQTLLQCVNKHAKAANELALLETVVTKTLDHNAPLTEDEAALIERLRTKYTLKDKATYHHDVYEKVLKRRAQKMLKAIIADGTLISKNVEAIEARLATIKANKEARKNPFKGTYEFFQEAGQALKKTTASIDQVLTEAAASAGQVLSDTSDSIGQSLSSITSDSVEQKLRDTSASAKKQLQGTAASAGQALKDTGQVIKETSTFQKIQKTAAQIAQQALQAKIAMDNTLHKITQAQREQFITEQKSSVNQALQEVRGFLVSMDEAGYPTIGLNARISEFERTSGASMATFAELTHGEIETQTKALKDQVAQIKTQTQSAVQAINLPYIERISEANRQLDALATLISTNQLNAYPSLPELSKIPLFTSSSLKADRESLDREVTRLQVAIRSQTDTANRYVARKASKEQEALSMIIRQITIEIDAIPKDDPRVSILNGIKTQFETNLASYLRDLTKKQTDFIQENFDILGTELTEEKLHSLTDVQRYGIINFFCHIIDTILKFFEEDKNTYKPQFFSSATEESIFAAADQLKSELTELLPAKPSAGDEAGNLAQG